jgi:hypothetical protein
LDWILKARFQQEVRNRNLKKDSEKTEQEESSENDAFRNSFRGSAYSLSSSGK